MVFHKAYRVKCTLNTHVKQHVGGDFWCVAIFYRLLSSSYLVIQLGFAHIIHTMVFVFHMLPL
jgi:hypothetical protein